MVNKLLRQAWTKSNTKRVSNSVKYHLTSSGVEYSFSSKIYSLRSFVRSGIGRMGLSISWNKDKFKI